MLLSEDRSGAHAVSMDADVGIAVRFSRSAEKAPAGLAAGLSKLNSMQALEAPVAGPVDMLGRTVGGRPCLIARDRSGERGGRCRAVRAPFGAP